MTNEAALVSAAQKGNVAAFNQLVRSYQALVYHTAYRVLGNAEAAEDATQEAFVSAFRHIQAFRGGSFKAWVMRIATNACYDQLRARKRKPGLSLEGLTEELDDPTPRIQSAGEESPQDFAERRELDRVIEKGLQAMSVEQRVTLVLADIEEFSYEEIAEIMQTNSGTVKSRLARGRAWLRDFLLAQDGILPRAYRYSRPAASTQPL